MFESFLGVNPWTALFVLLNTLTIYFVAKKFLFGPVMQIIADRQQEIDDLYADAEKNKETAETLRTEYEQKLQSAKQDGEQIVRDAMVRGQTREEEILRQAKEEAEALLAKAREDAQTIVEDAKWSKGDYDLAIETILKEYNRSGNR